MYYLADHAITCGTGGLAFGTNASTAFGEVNRTGGTITSGGRFVLANLINYDAGGGAHSVAGNLAFGTATKTLTGSSWTLAGASGTQQVTSSGAMFPSLVCNNGGAVTELQDSLHVVGTLTLTAGRFDQNGQPMYIGGAFAGNSTDTTDIDARVVHGGANWTWGASAKPKYGPSARITHIGDVTVTTNGVAMPIDTVKGKTAIADGATWGAIVIASVGDSTIFPSGDTTTVSAADSTHWSGAPGNRNYFLGSTPGTPAVLRLPARTGFAHMYLQDIWDNDSMRVNDGTSISGGGNRAP